MSHLARFFNCHSRVYPTASLQFLKSSSFSFHQSLGTSVSAQPPSTPSPATPPTQPPSSSNFWDLLLKPLRGDYSNLSFLLALVGGVGACVQWVATREREHTDSNFKSMEKNTSLKFDQVNLQITHLEEKVNSKFTHLEDKFDSKFSAILQTLEDIKEIKGTQVDHGERLVGLETRLGGRVVS
ncbi:hypothetical protein BDR26DRAFT_892338 [Obelidium mucronatum]|nr:hypothetical protein BDR26DRAFT_892338 [Obelidium mucronatum]